MADHKDCGCQHGNLKWTIIAIIVFAVTSGVVFGATGAILLPALGGKYIGAVLGAVLGAYVGRNMKVTRFTDLFILPNKRRK
jgi:uncharacterized membrane protein YfcA